MREEEKMIMDDVSACGIQQSPERIHSPRPETENDRIRMNEM